MSVEDLLKVRYKVIADFPQWSSFRYKKGDILELRGIHFVGEGTAKAINEKEIVDYPGIFKKLEWWEDREEKDMPKYLKKHDEILLIKEIDYSTNTILINKGYLFTLKYYLQNTVPATEKEYLEYIKQH